MIRIHTFILRIATAVIFVICPLAANAISPPGPAGALCDGSYVIVGRVLTATAHDCRDDYKGGIQRRETAGCQPKHVLHLKIYVVKLLSKANTSMTWRPVRDLRMGEVIDVVAISGHEENGDHTLYDVVLSNEQLAHAYAGKEFIVAVRMPDWLLNREPGPWVSFWPMSKIEWVKDILGRSVEGCPALL